VCREQPNAITNILRASVRCSTQGFIPFASYSHDTMEERNSLLILPSLQLAICGLLRLLVVCRKGDYILDQGHANVGDDVE
jgi:hypothetical protein